MIMQQRTNKTDWYWNLLFFVLDLVQTDISLKQWKLSTLTLFLFKTVWMLILEEWDAIGPVLINFCHFNPQLQDTIQHLTETTHQTGAYPKLFWAPPALQKRPIIAQLYRFLVLSHHLIKFHQFMFEWGRMTSTLTWSTNTVRFPAWLWLLWIIIMNLSPVWWTLPSQPTSTSDKTMPLMLSTMPKKIVSLVKDFTACLC